MAVRFRKSFKVAPGLRLNIGKKGASLTVGPRGSSVSIGKQGVYTNVGGAGTGLSLRSKVSSSGSGKTTVAERKSEAIEDLTNIVDEHNETINSVINQHIKTPNIEVREEFIRSYVEDLFALPQLHPELNVFTKKFSKFIIFSVILLTIGLGIKENKDFWIGLGTLCLFISLFMIIIRSIKKSRNKKLISKSQLEIDKAIQEREAFIKSFFDMGPDAVDTLFNHVMSRIDCVSEVIFSYEFRDNNEKLWIDIDLPEIEDIPLSTKIVRKGTLSIEDKQKRDDQIAIDYQRIVHSLIIRISGTCFTLFPSVKDIICSGYTQRISTVTGKEFDCYILSAIFTLDKWKEIDVKRASPIDVYQNFQHRRDIDKSGQMLEIKPFDSSDL